MARYFLKNPEKEDSILRQRGQTECEPIYYCGKTGSFWLLTWRNKG